MYTVRDLLTTMRIGKIYDTLSKEFYNGQEIRSTSNFRVIPLGKVHFQA